MLTEVGTMVPTSLTRKRNHGSYFCCLPARSRLTPLAARPTGIIAVGTVAVLTGATALANPNFRPIYVPLDLYDQIECMRWQIALWRLQHRGPGQARRRRGTPH